MKKYITKDDIEYMGNTLFNYYYLRRQEQKYIQESIEIESEKQIESYNLKNSSCNGIGNGCSVTSPKNASLDRLIKKQIEYDTIASRYKMMYVNLDKNNDLMKRFKIISVESQIMINFFYQRELTIHDIAKIINPSGNISEQAVRKKLDKALKEMVGAIR